MTERYRSGLLWAGLIVAFSPAIASLIAGILSEPSNRYTLLALGLLALLLVRPAGDRRRPERWTGGILLALGSLVQLFGAAASSWSIARVGLPFAILGVGLILGRPAPSKLVLAFGLVPIPAFVYDLGSPAIESRFGELAGGVLAALGGAVEVGGPLLKSGGMRFELLVTDSGLVTAVCLAEFLWYRSVHERRSTQAAILRSAGAILCGFAVQPLLVVVATAALPLGFPELGRFLLSYGVPISLAAVALADAARWRRCR